MEDTPTTTPTVTEGETVVGHVAEIEVEGEFDLTPLAGDFVFHHHGVDGRDWPALILDTQIQEGTISDFVCHLQVFRPRGNFWTWATEGENPGQWSWAAK